MTYYVAYFNQSSRDPRRFGSLAEVKRAFREDHEDFYSDWADVYGPFDSAEPWESAERFTGIGCPFDGIDVRLTIGPRGGVLTERG